jgi:hypothetical protein
LIIKPLADNMNNGIPPMTAEARNSHRLISPLPARKNPNPTRSKVPFRKAIIVSLDNRKSRYRVKKLMGLGFTRQSRHSVELAG